MPGDASYLGNRAAALMMVEDYQGALKDCLKAIQLDPTFIKAFIRASKCFAHLGRLDEADELFNSVHARVSGSFDVQNEVRWH